MLTVIRVLLLLFFGALCIGTGLCTLMSTPALVSSPGIVIFWLPGALLCVGSFLAARYFVRALSKKTDDDPES
jgi:TRAP-type C4-dicarboxylate transport system permease small subunit